VKEGKTELAVTIGWEIVCGIVQQHECSCMVQCASMVRPGWGRVNKTTAQNDTDGNAWSDTETRNGGCGEGGDGSRSLRSQMIMQGMMVNEF
jgi:hypothetical protein